MHEWAIAQGIIDALNDISSKERMKIKKVKISVGELSNYDLEVLEYALKSIASEVRLNNVDFELKIERTLFKCNYCNSEWAIEDIKEQLLDMYDPKSEIPMHYIPEIIVAFLKCPNCGSPDFNIIAGRGVKINEIELQE